jgi:hypothetical protein
MECNANESIVSTYNTYGLTDQDISKRSWQIAVGDASIVASFGIIIDVTLSSNVGNVIEVTADLFGEITGNLTLNLGTGDLLPFGDWLIALTNIFDETNSTGGYVPGFFTADAVFEASFNATVEPSSPFNILGSAFAEGSFTNPFEIDFLSDETAYPNISLDVEIDGLGDVRKLTFRQVVEILGDALELLIGSNDADSENSVESCSGGLLGRKIGGVNVFTYQIPGELIISMSGKVACA